MLTRSPGRTPCSTNAPASPSEAASSSAYDRERSRQRTASEVGCDRAESRRRCWSAYVMDSPAPRSQPEDPSDDAPLNLGGSRVDRASDGIAQRSLDLNVGHESVS